MLKNLLLTLFSLCLALAGAELTVRYLQQQGHIYDFSEGGHNKGYGRKQTFVAKVRKSDNPILFVELDPKDKWVNSHGMRGPEISKAKLEGVYRIALIGDSVSYGYGVKREDSFAYLLEQQLNRRDDLSKPIQVLNFSVSGYGIDAYVELLNEKVGAFSPDLILVGYCLNDPAPTNAVFEAVEDVSVRNATYKTMGARSEFAAWLKYTVDQAQQKRALNTKFGSLYRDKGLIAKLERDFAELKTLSQKDNAKLAVVIFPYLVDFNSDDIIDTHETLNSILADAGIDHLDLRGAFSVKKPSFWRLRREDDTHPNAAGHQLIADNLLVFLPPLMVMAEDRLEK